MAASASGMGSVGSALGGVVSDIGSVVGAGYTIAGEEAAVQGFQTAAGIAFNNSEEARAAGKLQQVQTARQVYQVGSAAAAATAANGLKLEGSAASILRNTAAQGAVANQLIGTQTQINVNGYLQQMSADQTEAQQAEDAAQAARTSQKFGEFGAVVEGVTAIAETAAMVAA